MTRRELLVRVQRRAPLLLMVLGGLLWAFAAGQLMHHVAAAPLDADTLPAELVRHRLNHVEAELRSLRDEHRALGWTMAAALGGVALQLFLQLTKPRTPT